MSCLVFPQWGVVCGAWWQQHVRRTFNNDWFHTLELFKPMSSIHLREVAKIFWRLILGARSVLHDIGKSFSNLELLAGANHYLLHHHHHHHPHTGVQITHYCIYLLQIPPTFLIKPECFTDGDHHYREHITRLLDSSQGFPIAMLCSHRIAESSSSNKT